MAPRVPVMAPKIPVKIPVKTEKIPPKIAPNIEKITDKIGKIKTAAITSTNMRIEEEDILLRVFVY